MTKPLFTDYEWDFDTLEKTWDCIDKIAKEDLGLNYYPLTIEVICSEQMLDCYSSHAMPIMYNHWSFGKSFVQNYTNYKKGAQGLAYEVVINTNPCIAYLMEDNTMTMQALVLAHAGAGHNDFFHNNYMFKDWTDAKFIVPYLKYAKEFIAKAEGKLGKEVVEILLDACHSVQYNGIFKYKRRHIKDLELQSRRREKWDHEEKSFLDMWRTIPDEKKKREKENSTSFLTQCEEMYQEEIIKKYNLPEENILYFIEKHSSVLDEDSREIVRIVRNLAQYFYPQMQTKLMNEGWACFIHYEIMSTMEQRGHITSGSYLEFLKSHSGVIAQPEFDSPYYSGINVYALGFAMFRDLKRIITTPTEEDQEWFPEIAGKQDWMPILQDIAYNFKDESFVLQWLSPKVIRDFKLFCFLDDHSDSHYHISGTARDEDIDLIRTKLSDQYNMGLQIPDLEIVDYDHLGDRSLTIKHRRWNGRPLEEKDSARVLKNLDILWGYNVGLTEEN